ncbi:MAG: DedA family protein, partial [Gemmatimonadaceae bacterium]
MLAWLARWGYLGLFAALFVEEAGVPLPVPGDVFIIAMGAASRAGRASFAAIALVVVCAVLSGSAFLFEMSRRLGQPLLLRVGRRFGFDADRADRVQLWLARRGSMAVVL